MYTIDEIRPGVFAIGEGGVRCYLITGTARALLLDTGYGTGDLAETVRGLYDGPVTLAHTHTHFDHTGADRQFPEIYAHPADWPMLLRRDGIAEDALRPLAEGECLDLGGRVIEVLETPGHTPGSVCFFDRENRLLFTGDYISDVTVYLCGPEADPAQYRESLLRILSMEQDCDVYLGCHGKAEQDAAQGRRLLRLVDLMLVGKVQGAPAEAHDGVFFNKVEHKGASFYLPLEQ